MLDFGNMEKAVSALHNALQVYDGSPLAEDAVEKVVIRDGVIQRFEFTFELSWKMLKRYLEEYGLEKVDTLSNRDLFRVGHEQGMIRDPGQWFHYLKMRNQTSHAYDDKIASEVFLAAREFLNDARNLLARLKEKTR